MATEAELKAIQQLTQSIGRQMDALSDKSDKRNKKLKQEADTLKSITSEISSAEDAAKARAQIQQRLNDLSSKNLGVNEGLKQSLKVQMETASKAIAIRQKEFSVVEKVGSVIDGVTEGMISGISKLSSQIQQVPVLGNIIAKPLEGAKSAIGSFGSFAKESFTNAFFTARAKGMSFSKSFSSGMSEMKLMARSLGPILANPYVLAAAAVAALLGAGLVAFYKIEKAARAYRDETGLLNSQTKEMEGNINSVYLETVGLGASMEDVSKNAAAFTNEFGGIEQPLEGTIKSMTVLNKNFGVSVQDSAKLNKAFQNMGGLSESVAQSQQESLVLLAKQSGVAPRQIMADIAESAEEANGFFRGNTMALGAAAINAAKMGSSLKQAVAVSKGLLNYQSSVSNEMEASAILGTNLNFSQSRYLAATGDVVGAQAAMVKQLRNSVDLQNLSVYEQEALEKATGMTLGEMQNMARLQEMNVGLNEEQAKIMGEALKAGLDISNMTDDQIRAKTEELAKQQEMQGELESMGNALSGVGAKLLQAFLPLGKMVVGLLKPIGAIAEWLGDKMAAGIKYSVNALGGLWKIVKGIFTLDFSSIGSGLLDIFKGPFTYLKELFPKTFGAIGNFITGLKDKFMKMIPKEVLDSLSNSFNSMKESWNKIKGTLGKSFEKIKTAFLPIKEAWTKIFGESKSTLFDKIGKVFGFVAGVVGTVIGKVFGVIASIVEKVANVFGLVAEVLNGDIGIGEALMGIGSNLFGIIMTIPSLLWDGFTSIFGSIGSWIKEKILSGLGSIGSYLFGDDAESSTETPIPSPITQTSTEAIAKMAASGDIAGAQAAANASNTDMSEVVNQLKALTSVTAANKDVYVSGKKVTDSVTRLQEKSNINQFGLMGA